LNNKFEDSEIATAVLIRHKDTPLYKNEDGFELGFVIVKPDCDLPIDEEVCYESLEFGLYESTEQVYWGGYL